MVLWKSLLPGLAFSDEPLKLRFIPIDLTSIPTSLDPTSNDDVVHPEKMSHYGLLSYSLTTTPDQFNLSWQVTQRIQMVCRPRVSASGIIGRPVPLLALPRPGTVRPLWRQDGVSSNLFANLIQSLMATFSHRRRTVTRASKASFPLHAKSDQPNLES